jgi:hypothetical protein
MLKSDSRSDKRLWIESKHMSSFNEWFHTEIFFGETILWTSKYVNTSMYGYKKGIYETRPA